MHTAPAFRHHQILKSISRSFFLSLRVLPNQVRPVISLGYLLCRAADTIADTDAVPFRDRERLLQQFSSLMGTFPLHQEAVNEFELKVQSCNLTPSSAEGRLLSHIRDSLMGLKLLSRTDQSLIQEIVQAVIRGMLMDLNKFGQSVETLKGLEHISELEIYIGWIGGEPGRFWSKVCLDHFPNLKIKDRGTWINDGILFGTGLQMVNILRDLTVDLKLGRCYIPEALLTEHKLTLNQLLETDTHPQFLPLYHQLIDETLGRLEHGVNYLDQIPLGFFRLRAAAWWPLVLGLKTLTLLRNNYFILDPQKKRKISRFTVWITLVESLIILWIPFLLRRRFNQLKGLASAYSAYFL